MKDVKFEFSECSILADRAYLSAELQQDLFSSAHIKLEVRIDKHEDMEACF